MRPPRGLAPIIVVFVLHHTQHNMMRPYVPLYAASLDIGYLLVGIVAASLAFLPMFLALPLGSWTDRWGVRLMIVVGSILSGLAYLMLWGVPNIVAIVASQLTAGVANLLIVLGAQSYVASLGRGIAAERNFSIYTIFASIGQILGPFAGGLLVSTLGFGGSFLSASSLSAMTLIAAIVLLPSTRHDRQRSDGGTLPRRALGYLRRPATRLAIIASCLMSVPEILRTSFLPIYLGEVVKLDPAYLGYILSLFSVAGLVAKSVLPRIVMRFGRQVMLFTISIMCAVALATVPLSASVVVVSTLTITMGITFGLGRPLSMAMAANSADTADIGLVVGLRLSGNRIADFFLPLAFGAAASIGGIAASFYIAAAFMLAGTGYLAPSMIKEVRGRRRKS